MLARITSATLKKIKAKGDYYTTGNKEPCKNNDSIKKKDWCYLCRAYTEKYIFHDFEATQNTGTHTVNLSIAQDFSGREYLHNNAEEFCKCFLNDKFKGYTLIAHNSKGYDSHFVLKSIKVLNNIAYTTGLKSCLWKFQNYPSDSLTV